MYKNFRVLNQAKGFTLVELLVVLAILVIGASVAVPSYNAFTMRNRVATASNEFVSALSFARMEAIKRGYQVGIGAVAPVAGNEWGGGFVVWADIDNDNVQGNGEDVLRSVPASGRTELDSQTGVTFLGFDSRGFANANDVIRLCDGGAGSRGVEIELLRSGRFRVNQSFNCP